MSTPTTSSFQPYAPTPYIPSSLLPSSIQLDQEQTLYTSTAERELYASLAEIHAILVSLEFLEKAFIKDTISAETYTPVCLRLINQYVSLLDDPVVDREISAAGGLEAWKHQYGIECPTATRRLAAGVPATTSTVQPVEELKPPTPELEEPEDQEGKWKNVSPKMAAEATQNFITVMDALRLHYRAPDELHPLLAPVIASVDAVRGKASFEGRGDIVKWLIRLNQMKAGEEITEEQQREMLWDVDRAYNQFIAKLG